MKSNKPLDSIVYISIPENLKTVSDSLILDPGILLPVEVPDGIDPANWDTSSLSWEMIISGMLKILAYDTGHKDAKYFRDFILSVKPKIIEELTQSAIVKARTHHYELTEEIFKALIGLQPDQLRHKLNLAIMFENQGNYLTGLSRIDEAAGVFPLSEDLYLQLIETGENLPDVYLNSAWFFYNRQDFSKTCELLDLYIQYGEDEVKITEAKKLLKDAAALKGQNNQYKEAYLLITQDRNQEGVETIDAFLAENPEVWNAWFLKGWGLRKLERFEEALSAFSKAFELNNNQVEVLNELAICQMELSRFEEAENSLMKAFQKEPENTKVISNMGILSLKQNKNEEALGFFYTVLELEPEDPIALEYINFIKKT